MLIPLAMLNGLGQLALVAILFGLIKRLALDPRVEQLALGLLFGCGSVAAMMTAAPIIPGVIVDARAIFLGLAGAFVGAPAAILAGMLSAAYRLWLGGQGVGVGLASIAVAVAVGIVFARRRQRKDRISIGGLAIIGGAIALHAVPALLYLLFWAAGAPPNFYATYFPTIIPTCFFATMTLGWMMQRELTLIGREASLTGYAFADPLTGIANRRAFAKRLASEEFRPDGTEFGVVILDIDHFKSVNDRFGHDCGDVVLQALGTALTKAMRDGDLVARYGGEEFVVLLPRTSLAESAAIAERLRRTLEHLTVPGVDAALSITASLGVTSSARFADHRSLLAAADLALYRAKELGRNRVELASQMQPSLSIVA